MTTFTLEPQYLFKLSSMPRGFNTTRAVSNRCNVPFYTIVVDFLGNCLLCDCDGWLPLPVGKVQDFDSIQQVFDSPAAKLLQQDVSQGNFSWCAVDHCGIRQESKLKNRVTLYINIDESCNLACPSCRRSTIMLSQGPEFERKSQDMDRIVHWLSNYPDPIRIVVSGNGDPLASHIMRKLLLQWQPKPQQTFKIMTNGLLIKKTLDKMPIMEQIVDFGISIDAGSESVYEDVRRPGKWSVLLENLEYLRSMDKNSLTTLNFALQNKNFQDLPAFAELCDTFGMSGSVHQLDDWGTWNIMEPKNPDVWTIQNGIFADHDVLDSGHANHARALDQVRQLMDHPRLRFAPAILDKIHRSNQSDLNKIT